jgi:hypothetical protein
MSPDERHAIVLLAIGAPSDDEPHPVVCHRTPDGWEISSSSSSSSGHWRIVEEEGEMQRGVSPYWGQAPEGATEVCVTFPSGSCRIPVIDGYYLFAVWGVLDVFDFPGPPDGRIGDF